MHGACQYSGYFLNGKIVSQRFQLASDLYNDWSDYLYSCSEKHYMVM